MTGATRFVAIGGVSLAAAALVGIRWLGPEQGGGLSDDVGRVELRDVLIARDGQMHEGRLEACNATGCRLNDRTLERSSITFIGLGVETAMPPAVEDPSRDELRLREGAVVHETLAQIDENAVFAGARRFERGVVAWIYLAPERAEPEPQAAGEPTPEPEPPRSPPPPPPPCPPNCPPPPPPPQEESEVPPPPQPRPPQPPDAAFRGCPEDRPLGAWIWLRDDYEHFRNPICRGVETHVVRFRLVPDPGTQMGQSAVALSYGAQELHYEMSTSGCFDLQAPDDYTTCNAEGTQLEGTTSLSQENLGYAKFFPLGPRLVFQYPTGVPFELTTHCLHHPTGTRSESPVSGIVGLEISPERCADPTRQCSEYCVAPTECQASNFAAADCVLHAERYAVIPFAGAMVAGHVDEYLPCAIPGSSQVRWHVCCGCAETGPPPDFDPRPAGDPCENAAAQLEGLIGRLRGLAEAYRSHEDSLRCAEAGREVARDRIWGLDGSWTQYFASLPWVATTGVRAPAGGRAEMLDNTRRIVADLIEWGRALQEGRRNYEGAVQWLIDMAGTTQAWRNAEDPMRAEYARAWAEAKRLAEQFLRRNPGDMKTAAQIFDQEFAARAAGISPRRGLNALGALRNLSAWSSVWEHSSRLVHDVSVYFAWKEEEQRARRDMETAQDQMRDAQAEIDALRARCPDLPPGSGIPIPDPSPQGCPDLPPGHEDLRTDSQRETDAAAQHAIPGAPGTSDVLNGVTSSVPTTATGSASSGATGGAATTGGSGQAERARAAQQRLEAAVQRMGTRMAQQVSPRLAPLLLGLTEAREPEYVGVLLEKAGAELQALMPDLVQASAAAEEIQQTVEALQRSEAATPRSP